jgi:hypothetical protein
MGVDIMKNWIYSPIPSAFLSGANFAMMLWSLYDNQWISATFSGFIALLCLAVSNETLKDEQHIMFLLGAREVLIQKGETQ